MNPLAAAMGPRRRGLVILAGCLLLAGGCSETNELPRPGHPRKRRIEKRVWLEPAEPPWKILTPFEDVSTEERAAAESAYRLIDLPKRDFHWEQHDFESVAFYSRADLQDFLAGIGADIFSIGDPRRRGLCLWESVWAEEIEFEREALVVLRYAESSGSIRVAFGGASLAARQLTFQVETRARGDLRTNDLAYHYLVFAVDKTLVDTVRLKYPGDHRQKTNLAIDENRRDPMPPLIDCGHVPSEAEVNMFCGTELHPSRVMRDAWGAPTCSRTFNLAENRGKRHSGNQGIRWEVVTWTNANRDLVQLYDLHLRESMAPTTRMSTKVRAPPRHLARHRAAPIMNVTAIEDLGQMASAISPVAKDSDAGHEVVFVKGRYLVVLKSARQLCTLGNLTALAHRISKRLEER